MYQKFRKHKLTMASAVLRIIFYTMAIFGNFVAPQETEQFSGQYVNCGPTKTAHNLLEKFEEQKRLSQSGT